jgi:hypothetical protein
MMTISRIGGITGTALRAQNSIRAEPKPLCTATYPPRYDLAAWRASAWTAACEAEKPQPKPKRAGWADFCERPSLWSHA